MQRYDRQTEDQERGLPKAYRVKKIEKIRGRPNAYCTVLYRMLTEEEMPLDIRRWTCPGCGTIHDRDVNAARNILKMGASTLEGGAVNPAIAG